MSDRVQDRTSDEAIESALAAMRTRYRETSRGFLATFESIGAQLANAPNSGDLLTSLRRELHRVHGTAGSLGFHEAGRMTGAMEGLVRGWSDNPAMDRDRRSSIVLSFARALADALADASDTDASLSRQIVLLGLADPVADRLVAEAVHRGFTVERVDDATRTLASRTAPPWGVVAMEASVELVTTAEFHAAACVLLSVEGATRSVHRPTSSATLDSATAATEIIDRLERIARQAGVAVGTVLLVDDDPMMLLLLRTLAEREGLSVETAATGAAFKDVLTRLDPAFVVLDVQLPDADGIELLRGLRADRQRRDLPVLMLSGRADADARAAAFDAGADDYMVKPVVPAEFQRRILQLLELRRERCVSTGVELESGLPLPERTMQDVAACLLGRGEVEWSIGVVRPLVAPLLAAEIALWRAECVRLARAVRDAGGSAGLMDEPGLAITLPLAPLAAESVLRTLAGNVAPRAFVWHSGIVGTNTIADGTVRTLISAASDACSAARDAMVPVRIWIPRMSISHQTSS